jgi:ribosomal protein L32
MQSPSTFNGVSVKRNWISAGGKPKNFAIIFYNNFKLVQCTDGYVLLCVTEGCKNLVNCNFKCKNHNTGKEIYSWCRNDYCLKQPSFGFEHKKPLFCKDHKTLDMFDVVHKKCEFEGCDKLPCFGFVGETPKYCSIHKPDGMIDITHKQCEFPNCTVNAKFGIQGSSGKYCSIHKDEGMINVYSKRCEFYGCNVGAYFGFEGQTVKFCVNHKEEGMVDIKSKRCKFPNCKTHPNFAYEGQMAQYCLEHKLDNMINVNIKSCEFHDCTLCPSYGKLYTGIRLSCREHSILNYYSHDKLNPICQVISCPNPAYFIDPIDPNIYPIRCHIHQYFTDIELIFKSCSNCGDKLYFPSDKKLCMKCGQYRGKKLYHFKETMVKHFFTSNNISFIHNRRISSDGSRYQPDFLIKSKFGYIIVEVDEHQHRDYDKEEEIIRMQIIYDDIQLISLNSQVLFIRFNPDRYNGIKVDIKKRYEYLYNIIKHFINLIEITIPLGQLKLFYNEFNGNPSIEPLCHIIKV